MNTAATTPPKTGLRKVNLGGITTAKTEKKGKDYPVLPDPDGSVSALVRDISAETEQLDALEGSLAAKKGELTALARAFFFEHLHGRHDIPSSIDCKNCDSNVLVTFQNRYKAAPDDGPIVEAIGPDLAGQFFRQSFALKIDGDKIPDDKADQLIADLQTLFEEHGCSEALTATACFKPTKDFHTARHSALTVEQNMAIERVAPIIPMVKTSNQCSVFSVQSHERPQLPPEPHLRCRAG